MGKDAGAKVTVRLHRRPEQEVLCVCDDGLGFDPESPPPDSLGLGAMRERASASGAGLEIRS